MTGSFKNAVQNWILQIEPSPSLLLGSRVELHPLAHAQSATLNCVQRLSPKKGASDKNSLPESLPLSCMVIIGDANLILLARCAYISSIPVVTQKEEMLMPVVMI